MPTDKVALVTGSSRGIGRATARTLAAEGYRIAAMARSGDQLESLVCEIETAGGVCLPLKVDITEPEQVECGVARTLEAFGRLDVMANVAGIILLRTLTNTSLEAFDRILNVNLRGAFIMMKAVVPHMIDQRRGSIVNVSSVSAHLGYSHHAAYSASKAGVLRLTETTAEELRDHDIRVNAVCPSGVATDLFGKDLRKLDRSRWLQPEDVADVIAFLVSDKARGITGACVDIKGMYVVSVDEVRPYLDLMGDGG